MNLCNSVSAIHSQCLSLVEMVLDRPSSLSSLVSRSLDMLHQQIYFPKSLRERIILVVDQDTPRNAAATISSLIHWHILPNFLDNFERFPVAMNLQRIVTLLLANAVSTAQRVLLEKSLRAMYADAHPHASIAELLLFVSIHLGKTSAFMALLSAKAVDINATDKNGRTPLQYAVLLDAQFFLWKLIEAGAHLNAQDLEGMTALHHAIDQNRGYCVDLLLSLGEEIDLEVTCKTGLRVIHLAVLIQSIPIFRKLLHLGASIEAAAVDEDKQTLLHFAASLGYDEFVREVLTYKKRVDLANFPAYLNAQNSPSHTAFHLAWDQNHCGVMECLLEFKAVPPARFLFSSVIYGSERVVQQLASYEGILMTPIAPDHLPSLFALDRVLLNLKLLNKNFYQKKIEPMIENLDIYGKNAVVLYDNYRGDFSAMCNQLERMAGYFFEAPKMDFYFKDLRAALNVS